MELENVGASVMADDVEVHFAADDLGAVDFGNEDGFVFEIRSGEEIAEGVDDATSAPSDDGVWIVAEGGAVIGRKITAAIELVARKNKATAFDGDVANGGKPRVARIGSGRAVKLDSFPVHGGTH